MNKLNLTLAAVGLTLITQGCAAASVQNASNASEHSVMAVVEGTKFSGKVVSATVAVPLLVVGNIGPVSKAIGEVLMDIAIGEPLEVTDTTITVTKKPADALKTQSNKEGAQ